MATSSKTLLISSFVRIGMAALLGAVLVTPAQADPILFDPDGPGSTPAFTINGLGFGPGNVLAQGSIPLTAGKTFQLYFQTHLTSLSGPQAPAAVPGLNTAYQITEVGTLTAQVTAINVTPNGTQATFALIPGATDQIKIYENNAVVFNDAAGTGFTAGTVIATINPSSFISSDFTNASGPNANKPLVDFNQTTAGNDSTTGLATQGSGSTNLLNTTSLNLYNHAFFNPPSGLPELVTSIFNTNLNSVFDAVSPSLRFTNPITNTTLVSVMAGGVGPNSFNIGAVNGLPTSGPDFQLQSSGFTQSFSAVPEPGTVSMAVVSCGVFGLGYVARRRRARAAA